MGRAPCPPAGCGRPLRPRGPPRRRAPRHRGHPTLPPASPCPHRPDGPGRAADALGAAPAGLAFQAPGGAHVGRGRGSPLPRRASRSVGGRPRPPRAPHRQPRPSAAQHGGRGPGARGTVLPLLGGDERGGDDPLQLLHDRRGVRAVPQGHLRAVELLRPPLLVLQQPVVPQVDRVHAGHRRDRALEVVRRLPRPRGALQRPLRHTDPGADRHPRGPDRPRLRRPATRSCTSRARWARATSRSSTRRCTTSR